jgi:hypothetical protein
MKLLKGAHLTSYRPRKDKSFSLTFETQEQEPNEVMLIHSMLDTFGYLYFKSEEQLTKAEIEEIDNLDTDLHDKAKTQSQRLRNTLFVSWKYNDRGFSEFKDYYKHRTEKIIDLIKKELPD